LYSAQGGGKKVVEMVQLPPAPQFDTSSGKPQRTQMEVLREMRAAEMEWMRRCQELRDSEAFQKALAYWLKRHYVQG